LLTSEITTLGKSVREGGTKLNITITYPTIVNLADATIIYQIYYILYTTIIYIIISNILLYIIHHYIYYNIKYIIIYYTPLLYIL